MATWAPIDPRLRLAKTIEKTKQKTKNNIPGDILAKTLEKKKERTTNNTFAQIRRAHEPVLLKSQAFQFRENIVFLFVCFSRGSLLV